MEIKLCIKKGYLFIYLFIKQNYIIFFFQSRAFVFQKGFLLEAQSAKFNEMNEKMEISNGYKVVNDVWGRIMLR